MQERLQKLIAQAGLASRRHAEELITSGAVTVNGVIVTELGSKADPRHDQIAVKGTSVNQLLSDKEKVYVLLHKPKGYLTSVADPEGRKLVTDLVPPELGRVHPVGRLDYNTEGLLILTNDGALTNFITTAKNGVAKVYEVKVKGTPPEFALERLRRGIALDDGARTAPAEIVRRQQTEANAWVTVTLHEGRNQQIRKMFDAIGHSVLKLRRVAIGPIRDDKMPVGAWRHLLPFELSKLRRAKPSTTQPRKEKEVPAPRAKKDTPKPRKNSRPPARKTAK